MRPELNERFCGRCGEPCGGFEEPAPGIDPPRRCADCAIDVRLPIRARFWFLSALLCLGFAAFIGGATLSLRFRLMTEGWTEASLLRGFLFVCAGATLFGGMLHFSREAMKEGEYIRKVRRQNRRAVPDASIVPPGAAIRDTFLCRLAFVIGIVALPVGARVIYLLSLPARHYSIEYAAVGAGPADWGAVITATAAALITIVYCQVRMEARWVGWMRRVLRRRTHPDSSALTEIPEATSGSEGP